MHTAEEVRKEAMAWTLIDGGDAAKQMLLAYADLLEAMEEYKRGNYIAERLVEQLCERAAEKQKARKV